MKKAPSPVPFLFPLRTEREYTERMQVRYRWMTEADIPAIETLARRIWPAHYSNIISPQQIDYMLARGYSPASLKAQLKGGDRFLLGERNDNLIGFLSIGPLAHMHDSRKRGINLDVTDYFLHKFYLAPEVARQGIGSRMLAELLARIPVRRLRLQVNRRNAGAWKFYQNQGFTIECEIDFAIGQGYRMDDYLMEKWIF